MMSMKRFLKYRVSMVTAIFLLGNEGLIDSMTANEGFDGGRNVMRE